jgi:Uma2 family endonuclease
LADHPRTLYSSHGRRVKPHDSLTVDEYLKLEESATVRHEYVGVENEPCLVVEVVSSSTETTDRREKLATYKRMPGLEAYLIVSQDRQWVERHFRADGGTWSRADLVDEGRVPIPCPETELSLEQIYEGL